MFPVAWNSTLHIIAISHCIQAHYSIGAVAQSFTSTTHVPVTENEAAIVDRDILRYRLVKSKGVAIM